jgi:hypothetical protein
MTTITIKKSQVFSKTNFESPQELYAFLRDQLSPVPIFFPDDDDIPKSILDSIHKAEAEGDNDIIDFQG